MFASQQPDFAAASCMQGVFPVNIAMVYVFEEEVVAEAFVGDTAAMSSYHFLAPIGRDRTFEDLEDRFLVDCTGRMYIEQEEEAPAQEEEEGDTQKPPPPCPRSCGTLGGGGTPTKYQNPKPSAHGTTAHATPQPTARPEANKTMSAFAAQVTPSQQTPASNAAAVATNPDVDAHQLP